MKPDEIFPIADVSDIDMAFGGNVSTLMPKYADIPEEFRRRRSRWNKLASDLFYCGVKDLDLIPRAAVDPLKALRHIRAILVSFEPKHEHKEAGVAYLLDQWFSDGTWQRAKKCP